MASCLGLLSLLEVHVARAAAGKRCQSTVSAATSLTV